MRRLLCISIALILIESGNAQYKFGFFGGPQATTSLYSVNGANQSTNYKYSFQLGVNWKVPFDNKLFFSPEIFYSLKGYKVAFSQYAYPPDTTATDNNTTIHCAELAALLQYDFSNKPNHFFLRGGPSIDFQLLGKQTFHLMNGTTVNQSMKYGFEEYGRYAANAIAQLGYESGSGFSVYAQYSFGLTNISNADFGPTIRHRVFGISFGKYFNSKKIVIDTRNKK